MMNPKPLSIELAPLKKKAAPVVKGMWTLSNIYVNVLIMNSLIFILIHFSYRGRSTTQKCLADKGEGEGCSTEERSVYFSHS